MARNLMITALLIAMSAPAIASSYQPSAERDALTTKFIEYRCSEVQNPTQPARADNNQKLYCQYLLEMIASKCSETSCPSYQAWGKGLNPPIDANSKEFDALLKQRGKEFRRSLSPSAQQR